ncbi:hypothetical protein PMIN05_004584 [Paraphaeosphaeria minitans]
MAASKVDPFPSGPCSTSLASHRIFLTRQHHGDNRSLHQRLDEDRDPSRTGTGTIQRCLASPWASWRHCWELHCTVLHWGLRSPLGWGDVQLQGTFEDAVQSSYLRSPASFVPLGSIFRQSGEPSSSLDAALTEVDPCAQRATGRENEVRSFSSAESTANAGYGR